MPYGIPYGVDDENAEKNLYNPLFAQQISDEGGGGSAYEKMLISELNAPKPLAEDEGIDKGQLAASLLKAANAMGTVGGQTADSSGMQNYADLLTKNKMLGKDKQEKENTKRLGLLSQYALLKDKQSGRKMELASGQREKEEDRAFKKAMDERDFAQKKELAQLGSEKAKPVTADEKTSALFATRAKDASDLAENIETSGYNPASYGASFRSTSLPFVGQVGATSEDRSYNQAKRSFISAVLRKESGAAISKDEYENEAKKYFPEPGDGPEQLAQKAAERSRAVQTLITASAGAYNPAMQKPFDYKKPAPQAGDNELMAAEPPAGGIPAGQKPIESMSDEEVQEELARLKGGKR